MYLLRQSAPGFEQLGLVAVRQGRGKAPASAPISSQGAGQRSLLLVCSLCGAVTGRGARTPSRCPAPVTETKHRAQHLLPVTGNIRFWVFIRNYLACFFFFFFISIFYL